MLSSNHGILSATNRVQHGQLGQYGCDMEEKQVANMNFIRHLVRCLVVLIVSLSIAPVWADSELPQDVDPRPSEPQLESLLSILRGTPENGWVRVNLNEFEDVWTPVELRVLYNGGAPVTPEPVISAWSSFAWDSRRGDLVIYGGGHANYGGNEVYRWRGTSRQWERISLPSEMIFDGILWSAIDGVDWAPNSAHTYDNNIYLPGVDRFLTFGGAAYQHGGSYRLRELDGSYRSTGPYFFDLSLADGNKVGGSTGSHPQWSGPHAEILGGEMWENRDVPGNIPNASFPASYIDGATGYAWEDGKDVVYVSANSGSTALALYRYTINNLFDPAQDGWEKVGRYWNVVHGQGTGAYLPGLDIFVRTGRSFFAYWDLAFSGPSNNDVAFFPFDASGEFVLDKGYGMDYDPSRNRLLLWKEGADVWALYPPAVVSTQGWDLEKLESPLIINEFPALGAGSGVLGKWKYIAQLDAFMALQDKRAGNVWLYKPEDWVEPSTDWPRILVTEPVSEGVVVPGDDLMISAMASDADGVITEVELLVNGQTIASFVEPPYTTVLGAVSAGVYTLEAIARDNDGNESISPAVSVIVENPLVSPPTVILTAPQSGSSYREGEDILLSAEASDADGSVSQVEFFRGGVSLGVDLTAPYTVIWQDAAAGSYTLTAEATDDEGAKRTSAGVTVDVEEVINQPPSVVIEAPLNGSVYDEGSDIEISATATDGDGSVSGVEFFWDGNSLGEDATAPYTVIWNGVAEGNYTLTAVATDDGGAQQTSQPVTVNVEGDNTPPGDLVVLRDGFNNYAGAADTALNRYFRTAALGSREELSSRNDTYNPLIRFAIFSGEGGPVLEGAVITSAKLSLYKSSYYNYSYRAHAVLLDWSEEEATWEQAADGMPWSELGGSGSGSDYAVAGSPQGEAGWTPGWLELDVTESVQAMSLGQQSNYGWHLVGVSGNSNTKYFYAREHLDDPSLRPRLEIYYQADGNANLRPTVTLTAPQSGSSYTEGEDILLSAEASDADGSVSQVEFFRGGVSLGVDLTAPYTVIWQDAAAGSYTLTAEATDDEGAKRTSAGVTVDVEEVINQPPSVVIEAPLNGSVYDEGSDIEISATATDGDGSVSGVEFFWDGNSLGLDATAPYTVIWNGVAEGNYTLTAVATDDGGAQQTSQPVTVNVEGDNTPPGDLVVLRDGFNNYAGAADTALNRYFRTAALGSREELSSRNDTYNPLIRFAIFSGEGGPVPEGAVITSAKLSLYKSSYYNYSYRAHAVLLDWSEEEATWEQAADGMPWSELGGSGSGSDYAVAGSPQGEAGWTPGWLELDVTESVQAMSLGQQSNYGWHLVGVSGNSNTKYFYAREHLDDPSLRPRLEIYYQADGNANLRPTVTLTAPQSGSSYTEGEDILLSAEASDADGSVSQVEFFRGGVSLGVDLTAPYTVIWQDAAAGSYTLTAEATDDEGAKRTSAGVTVDVEEVINQPPSVVIEAPLNGSVYDEGSDIEISATATDGDGSVSGVEFFWDGNSLGLDATAPYTVIWNGVAEGNYTLTAVATDDGGAQQTSQPVTVNVEGDNTPPGDLVVLRDGFNNYAGAADTALNRYFRTAALGSREELSSRNDTYNPLIRFAIFSGEGGPVPEGAVITSAKLSLYKSSYYNYSYRAHAVLLDWSEEEATWEQAADGMPWSELGGSGSGSDYAVAGSPQGEAGWTPGWLELDVTESVQAMSLGQQSNYGWHLVGVSGNSNTKYFYAREHLDDPSLRPRLEIYYQY